MGQLNLIQLCAIAAAVLVPLLVADANAQEGVDGDAMSRGRVFAEQGGAALYANICAACHMIDGRGAAGAAHYPALAAVPGYPITVVLHGLRGMPAFGPMLTDIQAADIVNYVRTHFDNHYDKEVSTADIRAARGPAR